MQQRKYKRIPVNIPLRFACGRTFVPGTAKNLSETGLFVNTKSSFPVESKMEVLMKLEDEILIVPIEIVRVRESDHNGTGMGVRILNVPKKYVECISNSY